MEPDRLLKRYRRRRRAAAPAQSHSNSAHSGESSSSLRHNVSGSGTGTTAHGRAKRAIPHIIYPEILVIVDYDGYRLHGGDNVQVFSERTMGAL